MELAFDYVAVYGRFMQAFVKKYRFRFTHFSELGHMENGQMGQVFLLLQYTLVFKDNLY